ncbi:rhomboid family intramembrane serine protease [Candidatus Pacearchaeota archaeon]|nr:hypothetical protein [uncultured archaeon]MBS3084401.1 rhomboid family intramembrane serine protease [Candidatus Pacearchaeota archaeon]
MAVYRVFPAKKESILGSVSVTLWLIIFNVIFFILFSVLISYEIIPIDYIALNPSNIINNFYPWTFLTSLFMHGGFFHLFVNMLSLLFVGGLLEKILGKKRFFSFYIISGFIAGLLFVLSAFIFTGDFNSYAVGASGAIFGLIGVLVFLTPNLPVYIMFIPIPIKMKYAAPAMLFIIWLISAGLNLAIGNVAHLGGLLSGIVYGVYLRTRYPRKVNLISRHFS